MKTAPLSSQHTVEFTAFLPFSQHSLLPPPCLVPVVLLLLIPGNELLRVVQSSLQKMTRTRLISPVKGSRASQ
jgi:hypothetical protein